MIHAIFATWLLSKVSIDTDVDGSTVPGYPGRAILMQQLC